MKEFIVNQLNCKKENGLWQFLVEWNNGEIEWIPESIYNNTEKDFRKD